MRSNVLSALLLLQCMVFAVPKPLGATPTSTNTILPTTLPSAVPSAAVPFVPTPPEPSPSTFAQIKSVAYANQMAVLQSRTSGCTASNVQKRKEWASLSTTEQLAWANAINCLYTKPALTSLNDAPGVRNRYDDFVGTHINQTTIIHRTAIFLAWHRNIVQLFENALKSECGYTGTSPYWEWSNYNADPGSHPMFSGTASSIGTNGVLDPLQGPTTLTLPVTNVPIVFPPGTGGGCIYGGPFINQTQNLGPAGNLGYNPRCITRNIRPELSVATLNWQTVVNLIKNSPDLYTFFTNVTEGTTNVHTDGHATIGGAEDDVYASPGDPVFFLHHAQVDRMWTLWQAQQDYLGRQLQVAGTLTFDNTPPSANGTLDTTMNWGVNGGTRPIRDLVSTIDGPFCYIYV